MEANIKEPLSLTDIAAMAGISRWQLERLFKRYVGVAPTRYYLGLRLDRARSLLLQGAMPILEAATACGFLPSRHFSKCYRDHFGHPPSAERSGNRIKAPAVQEVSRACIPTIEVNSRLVLPSL